MATPPRLRTRDFLHLVEERTLSALAGQFDKPVSRVVFSSLQLHFGEPHLHYEIWPVRKTGQLEIGLHLEGPQEWSRATAAQLSIHADELRSALGSAYELEDWTASWCRLHRTVPLPKLTDATVDDVSDHLLHLIRAVQPLLSELDLQPAPAGANGAGRRPFRRGSRGRRRRRRV
jgi:hypothetical protein